MESLPLTLVAMLITGVLIWDKQLSFSSSAFTGLGVGWTAIALLDIIGAASTAAFGRGADVKITSMKQLEHTPSDMRDALDVIDAQDKARTARRDAEG